MESKKMEPKNLFTGQQWRNRHRELTYGLIDLWEERVRWKSNMETYIPYVK